MRGRRNRSGTLISKSYGQFPIAWSCGLLGRATTTSLLPPIMLQWSLGLIRLLPGHWRLWPFSIKYFGPLPPTICSSRQCGSPPLPTLLPTRGLASSLTTFGSSLPSLPQTASFPAQFPSFPSPSPPLPSPPPRLTTSRRC
jgi:hypothetical protein